jgi:hypothetical protein
VKETLEDVKAHIQMNYLDKAKEALSEGISHINDQVLILTSLLFILDHIPEF